MKWLFDLALGGVGVAIKELAGPLERSYQAKLNAKNDHDRLEAEKAIKFYEGQIALAQTAAQNDKWHSPRTLMGWFATIYVGKLVVWDTVLKLGVTPDPGPQVTGIVMLVIGFYFGSKAATDIATKLLAALLPRGR